MFLPRFIVKYGCLLVISDSEEQFALNVIYLRKAQNPKNRCKIQRFESIFSFHDAK